MAEFYTYYLLKFINEIGLWSKIGQT